MNDGHSETLPGYVKYFWDAGYNVDLMINPLLAKEKSFFADFKIKISDFLK